jgi:hypothetical protein
MLDQATPPAHRRLPKIRNHPKRSSLPKDGAPNTASATPQPPPQTPEHPLHLCSLCENSAPSAVKDVEVFRQLVNAGQRLSEIHVHYEDQPEYPLAETEKAGEELDYWRVAQVSVSYGKPRRVPF